MTIYLNNLKTSIRTDFEQTLKNEAVGFENVPVINFLSTLEKTTSLIRLKQNMNDLLKSLKDGYVYNNPFKAKIAVYQTKITPEAIDVEQGYIADRLEVDELKKALEDANAALEKERNANGNLRVQLALLTPAPIANQFEGQNRNLHAPQKHCSNQPKHRIQQPKHH